ncbi:RNA 2',3'-cyclic phosphodiesterase [Desulfatitalea alkaliphila]|uniref:RNA 2',3'-cyclic phosphodiesterase n=1 Tax=Desulfatitalea alkaliphila TaxID=2929485 RepID=A0AA41URB0_9BACT|nr:RNA 2',3'-cyclic phosphodiesterase [Desulfatitalea alkaliphila]MCJ8502183.1 RNA 2',3'-cyclic phosphodiesterase [Desulfatitalea alkaliphila]
MGDAIRTFIAFPLPDHLVRLAGDLQAELKDHGLDLRWVRPANIHLTLKFLGEIPSQRVAKVTDAMQAAGRETPPLSLMVQGMGVFPGIRAPKVLWVGLGGATEALGRMQARLEERLAEVGFAPERRPFKAHLTLARIKARLDADRLLQGLQAAGGYAPRPFEVQEMVLYRSELRPRGAVYTPLAGTALCADAR